MVLPAKCGIEIVDKILARAASKWPKSAKSQYQKFAIRTAIAGMMKGKK